MLILKAVLKENRTTRNRFVWPEVGGTVDAPDWDEAPNCGAGLHGWLNGIGDVDVCDYGFDACTFLVVETTGPVVDLGGKVKFRHGTIVFDGSLREAAAYIIEETGEQGPVIGAYRVVAGGGSAFVGAYGSVDAGPYCTVTADHHCTVTADHHCTVTAGNYCTVTAGNYCTVTADHCKVTAGTDCKVTAGSYSTVTAGTYCTVTAGPYCTVTAGNYCTVTAGHGCTVTVGDDCTVTAGNYCTVTADYGCTVTADYGCTVTADYGCTVTAGPYCTVTADYGCTIMFIYRDGHQRVFVAYTGEDGVEPNQAYRLDSNHKLERINK